MRKQKNESPLESVFLGNIFTAIITLPFMFQTGPGLSGWICLLILGVLQLGIPYILYATAIKYVSALDSILISVIEPLLNPLWVFLLLGETPGQMAFIGGVIILTAIIVRYLLPLLRKRLFSDLKPSKKAL